MKKLKGILPQSMLFQVCKVLVKSHLRYADVVLGSLSNTKLSALQRLQNCVFDSIVAFWALCGGKQSPVDFTPRPKA